VLCGDSASPQWPHIGPGLRSRLTRMQPVVSAVYGRVLIRASVGACALCWRKGGRGDKGKGREGGREAESSPCRLDPRLPGGPGWMQSRAGRAPGRVRLLLTQMATIASVLARPNPSLGPESDRVGKPSSWPGLKHGRANPSRTGGPVVRRLPLRQALSESPASPRHPALKTIVAAAAAAAVNRPDPDNWNGLEGTAAALPLPSLTYGILCGASLGPCLSDMGTCLCPR
jgi:hypothetical protein